MEVRRSSPVPRPLTDKMLTSIVSLYSFKLESPTKKQLQKKTKAVLNFICQIRIKFWNFSASAAVFSFCSQWYVLSV